MPLPDDLPPDAELILTIHVLNTPVGLLCHCDGAAGEYQLPDVAKVLHLLADRVAARDVMPDPHLN